MKGQLFFILFYFQLVIIELGGNAKGQQGQIGKPRRKKNYKSYADLTPTYQRRHYSESEEIPKKPLRSKSRPAGKGRSLQEPRGWPAEEGRRFPDKKCRQVSGREKRQATTTFSDGDKLHITAYHPNRWIYCLNVPWETKETIYPIIVWDCFWHAPQTWIFENPSWAPDESWAVIRTAVSGKCLDAMDEGIWNETPVGVHDCIEEAPNQLWKVVDEGTGTVLLQDYNSCKCLSISTLDPNIPKQQWKAELSTCVKDAGKFDQVWTLKHVAKSHVTFFENPRWNGEQEYLHSNGECVNLPDSMKDRVRSVDTHRSCVTFYEKPGCQGKSVFLRYDVDYDEKADLNRVGLDNKVRSMKPKPC